jgi:DNA-binding transcriptional LysR family regulator
MADGISWELYRSLRAVLTEGSLSGAARALGVAQPTVGRHIATLERAFGAALFTRAPSGLLPTDTALALKPLTDSMQSTAHALHRVAGGLGSAVHGTVRVTASEVIGVEVLPPILASLRERHPQLAIEVVLSNKVQDLLRREADIAVRMTQPKQELLLARRVGDIALGFFAHPDYVRRCGRPSGLDDLAGHTLIGFDQPPVYLREPGIIPWRREEFALRADSDLAQLALIRAGAGIGICQVPIGYRHKLERLLEPELPWTLKTWITMHQDLRNSPRCRVTFDALVEGLKRHAAARP